MSEFPKTVGRVTVENLGGGYYELSSPDLTAPIKVRGLEKALADAEAISHQIESGLPAQALHSEDGGDDGPGTAGLAPEAELAALRVRVAELEAAGITVALPNPHIEAIDRHHERSAAIPSRLTKAMTPEQIAALEKVGVKTMRIMIDQTDEIPPGGLFLGHNGKTFMIQAGVEVDVPTFLVDMLNDAVMTQAITDPETRRVVGHRNRLRIPYRVIPVTA